MLGTVHSEYLLAPLVAALHAKLPLHSESAGQVVVVFVFVVPEPLFYTV